MKKTLREICDQKRINSVTLALNVIHPSLQEFYGKEPPYDFIEIEFIIYTINKFIDNFDKLNNQ